MLKPHLFILSLSVIVSAVSCSNSSVPLSTDNLKPRLVVMTDIGPADVEPDDNESSVRLMSYADRFEIEAICTTIGWNCDPYPRQWKDYLDKVVNAYEVDVNNLMKRSSQTGFEPIEKEQTMHQALGYWPSAEYIRSRCMYGSEKAGIGVIGEGNDSEGSEFLIKLALEDDPRPIWVTSWGGSNTLSQAIWRYSQSATPEQLKAFVSKFRIYTITDQDMQYNMRMDREYSSHMWLRSEYKDDLKFIWDESAWLNQNALGVQNWDKYAQNIQGKGEMGKCYPHYLWGVEGDTPSFLYVMPNGLSDPEYPTQVGWGGYHTYNISPDGKTYAWTNWQQPQKDISDAFEKGFYPDEFNDFAARMQWADKGEGNRNPEIVINGIPGISQVKVSAKAGKTLKISAKGTMDPDGDNLCFKWWQQKEAGTFNEAVTIESSDSEQPSVIIPSSAQGKTLHIICEVHDDGQFQLVAYRRIIVEVK